MVGIDKYLKRNKISCNINLCSKLRVKSLFTLAELVCKNNVFLFSNATGLATLYDARKNITQPNPTRNKMYVFDDIQFLMGWDMIWDHQD